MIWEILGISPTQNKTEIKRAYNMMLKKHHPEEDPDGFMQLREAYQQALKIAANPAGFFEPDQDKAEEIWQTQDTASLNCENDFTVIESFTEKQPGQNSVYNKAEEFYQDVFKRLNIESWKDFLSNLTLDEYQTFYDQAIYFFNDHACISVPVWTFLDQEFALKSNPSFYMPEILKYSHGLNYDFITSDVAIDYNAYLNMRFQALLHLKNLDFEEALEKVVAAEIIFDQDPSLSRLKGLALFGLKLYSQAIPAFTQAISTGNDPELLVYRGQCYSHMQNYDFAFQDFQLAKSNNEAAKGIILNSALQNNIKEANLRRKHLYSEKNFFDLEIDLLLAPAKLSAISLFFSNITVLSGSVKFVLLVIGFFLIYYFINKTTFLNIPFLVFYVGCYAGYRTFWRK